MNNIQGTEEMLQEFLAEVGDRPAHDAALPAIIEPDTGCAVPELRQGRRTSDHPALEAAPAGRREGDKVAVVRESTIRINASRLDHVLNLSGEIGLTRNRMNCLRRDLMQGLRDAATLRCLDETVRKLDHLVGDLQNALTKTRMQPVGRLFQKYPRLVGDLARQLGKDIELELAGGDTELDRGIIDELGDPLVQLVRNAVDHGIETPCERRASGKPEKSILRLSARQAGDRVLIEIRDDGRGLRPEVLRRRAVEQELLDADTASRLDDRQSLKLILLRGFSAGDQAAGASGRGVGMNVVKNNIQKLHGSVEIESEPGSGTKITIALPLTTSIVPVLVVRHGSQPFAVPLAMVHEIALLDPAQVQPVPGRTTMQIRGEVLPVHSLAGLLGWQSQGMPRFGVLMQATASKFVLAVDGLVGREDVVIKPVQGIKPRGVAGATMSGAGADMLVLDVEELLVSLHEESRDMLLAQAA